MAAVILTSVTVIGTGVADNGSTATTGGTITVTVTDLSRTFFRCQNDSTTASVILSFGAGADPMVAKGIGAMTVTLTTAQTQYVGASWDSSRFKTTSGTVVLTVPTAGTVTVDVGVMAVY